ncbi:Domain of uncharacterised function (DUF1998) [Burkholderia pseudomallei]|nr:Domain of uncharacterised function (DUF1998) [Burkholderia pseudomallei]CAJ8275717.1 Domain of uncharacterised function (DUF1998) [Burkholderia pseudomallei]CAJ8955854.1 Domain of uncharacterised function (DUF1998) [Burkholderia pseudomallei]
MTKHKVGDIRPTQLLNVYGVGAMIDLPNIAGMVMGLDDWDTTHSVLVSEERLLRAVRVQLGAQVEKLLLPPVEPDTASADPLGGAKIGVPVAAFPQWFRCPWCELLAPISSGLFELKTDPFRPDRARFVHANCSKAGQPPVALPARFQIACSHGHLDDFPWLRFVHRGAATCNGPLRLKKIGASDEAVDLLVKCDTCGRDRRMSDAFGEVAESDDVFGCRGRRPHLRDFAPSGCNEHAETMLLGASNSWFGISLSALSIPMHVDKLPQLVEERWAVLQHIPSKETVGAFRAVGNLKGLEDYSDAAVWDAIESKKNGVQADEENGNLKLPEWNVFVSADPATNTRDFQLTAVVAPHGYERYFEKVVRAERLREVRALTGFTRIESPGDYSDPSEIPDALRAPLGRSKPVWVPVSEVRGEGIFLQFSEEAIRAWVKRVTRQDEEMFRAHSAWRRARRIPEPESGYPGIRYALIHSFSHALMRQLSMEAGYSSASIRERIYAHDGGDDAPAMAGLLLYTAAPDSEGTLGGLVSLGEPDRLGRLIRLALEEIRLCASDPLCGEHRPAHDGTSSLHGAACHACMFSPETSCERGNKYLDRGLLVQTIGGGNVPFFE